MSIPVTILSRRFHNCLDFKEFLTQFNYKDKEIDLISDLFIEVIKFSRLQILCVDEVKPTNNTLVKLILSKIPKALSENRFIRILTLNRSYCNDISVILKSLIHHPNLISLDITKIKNIKSDFSKSLNEYLSQNKSLLKLNLFGNDFSSDDTYEIFSGLSRNTNLKQLFYSNNKVNNYDCKYISGMLSINKSLVLLCIDNTQIGNKGFEYIQQGLLINNCLLRISLLKNEITNNIYEKLCELLDRNKTLKLIDISNNVNLSFENVQKNYLNSNYINRVSF